MLYSINIDLLNTRGNKMILYHGKPKEMVGSVLYPLNSLKQISLHLHQRYTDKYSWRTHVMGTVDPLLGKLWNDFVFTLPIFPSLVFEAWEKHRRRLQSHGMEFYEINSNDLNQEKLVVYWMNGQVNSHPTNWTRFSDLTPEQTDRLLQLPERFIEELKGSRELKVIFPWIPHVMYAGEIDISNCRLIKS